ncbi:hypothetical protein F4823DRAFT_384702 [Ustulina deusta]|nr:hypothetical protein F4823DRAFT_384702 [Ustulina deusta]
MLTIHRNPIFASLLPLAWVLCFPPRLVSSCYWKASLLCSTRVILLFCLYHELIRDTAVGSWCRAPVPEASAQHLHNPDPCDWARALSSFVELRTLDLLKSALSELPAPSSHIANNRWLLSPSLDG